MDDTSTSDDELANRIESIKRLGLPADETDFLIATLKSFLQFVEGQEAP